MRLRDLDAHFIGEYKINSEGCATYRMVEDMRDAQGVMFQCPKCAQGKPTGEEDGRKFVAGAHSIICWFMHPINSQQVPDEASPKPGRWIAAGTGLDDLTFVGPNAASVLLTGGCNWHGFVKNGEAT